MVASKTENEPLGYTAASLIKVISVIHSKYFNVNMFLYELYSLRLERVLVVSSVHHNLSLICKCRHQRAPRGPRSSFVSGIFCTDKQMAATHRPTQSTESQKQSDGKPCGAALRSRARSTNSSLHAHLLRKKRATWASNHPKTMRLVPHSSKTESQKKRKNLHARFCQ